MLFIEQFVRYRALLLYFAPALCGSLILLALLLLGGDVSHPIKITIIVVFFALSLGTAIAAVVRELRRSGLVLQAEGQEVVEFEASLSSISIGSYSSSEDDEVAMPTASPANIVKQGE